MFVSFCSVRKASTRSSDSSDAGEAVDEKKKRDSRKSGFLNLIKSRSKPDRPQTATISEEPQTPKGVVKGHTAADSTKKETKSVEHNGSTEKNEELKTPDSTEEGSVEDAARSEKGDSKGSPQGGHRYGVQVMGSGLLAEMKAKQERRAASAQKVKGALFSF